MPRTKKEAKFMSRSEKRTNTSQPPPSLAEIPPAKANSLPENAISLLPKPTLTHSSTSSAKVYSPAVQPPESDRPESSRRHEAHKSHKSHVLPAPKRKKARLACGAPSLPPAAPQLNGHLKFPKQYKTRYDNISPRPFLPCKAIDCEFLSKCDLEQNVREYLSNVGWEAYLELTRPAYLELTRPAYYELTHEFYSTFVFNDKKGITAETPDVIQFRLMNKWCSFSLSEFNVALGFVTSELVASPDCDYLPEYENDQSLHWTRMTNDPSKSFSPGKSQDSHIIDPALRYLHRFLAFSFSGRKPSPTVCTKAEFFIMWCMANKVKLNFAYWIAGQFNSVVQNQSENRHKSLILGNLITNIAINLKRIDPDNHNLHIACDIEWLNEACLRKWFMLEKNSPTPIFVAPGLPWRDIATKKRKKQTTCVVSDDVDNVGTSNSSDDINSLVVKVDLLTSMLEAQQAQLDNIQTMLQSALDKVP